MGGIAGTGSPGQAGNVVCWPNVFPRAMSSQVLWKYDLDFFQEAGLSEQGLLTEIRKHLPFQAYGKGPVIDLLREMGCYVDKKTPLQVTDVFRSDESGEIVCEVDLNGQKASAALTNLKLDINHPLYRKAKNYRGEVVEELINQKTDINRSSFRVGDLYKKK